jgi:EAL domain-containing protein (putative c-di-GMP-specific phosphodiesterase class I)
MLARMGCDQGQGYFIGRPIPADQFVQWLRKWAPPQQAMHENMI